MSHLHLPDGVISPLWWVLGYIITVIFLVFSAAKVKDDEVSKRVPFIGVISALMLITMSIPLGAIPFHLNLTVLISILGGPWIGFISVFIVNMILALIGHGGITSVGLNTLIIGTEVIVGYYVFKNISKYIKPGIASVISVIIALLISNAFMLGIINKAAGIMEHKLSEIRIFNVSGWGAFILILLIGISIEALVTFLVVEFIMKVRPGMIKIEDKMELDN